MIGPLRKPLSGRDAAFFDAMARALALGRCGPHLDRSSVCWMKKADVIRLCRALGVPFELTLSCMQPMMAAIAAAAVSRRERIEAFREAGETDPAEASSLEP